MNGWWNGLARQISSVTAAWMLLLVMACPAAAQAPGGGWAPQAPIPGYLPETLPPIMVADANRTVHVFATQLVGDGDNPDEWEDVAIVYRQWSETGGWTESNDIILSPVKQARMHDVYLDPEGIFHLVFFGGDDTAADIYYTWAPAIRAGDARAWAPPVAIGPGAITPDNAGIVGDGKGNLIVVYSGNLGEGNSLYAVHSENSGVSWSDPAFVYSTYSDTEKPFDFDLAISSTGVVHAVWNVTDKSGQNVGGYYAQLPAPGETWSEPMALDTQRGLGIAIPAVIEHAGEIFLMYNNGLGEETAPVQWFRRSSDGGNTWSQPQRPFPSHIGRNGAISFAHDSSGTLHVFFGQRIPGGTGTGDLHGMWHATWQGGTWSPLEPVVSGPPTTSFDPYDATAVVSQGNVILLAWRTDPGLPVSSTWFSTARLATPELPVVPLPVPFAWSEPVGSVAAATPAPAQPVAIAEPTLPAPPAFLDSAQVEAPNPGLPLLVGLLPALGLTAVVLSVALLWRRRRV